MKELYGETAQVPSMSRIGNYRPSVSGFHYIKEESVLMTIELTCPL